MAKEMKDKDNKKPDEAEKKPINAKENPSENEDPVDPTDLTEEEKTELKRLIKREAFIKSEARRHDRLTVINEGLAKHVSQRGNKLLMPGYDVTATKGRKSGCGCG